ncbi:phytanoyl-CoA dioxygenase family protein [Herbaspirillum sp. NPDC101396]|uniref:phytanoyl-CoA dioxygenase family protein n=1 Tax=Herbaspirillum sp. NPDC101396 TaxID=3364005 RepID=UPI00383AE6E2
MSSILQLDDTKFWKDGYLILRNLFSPKEFATMRENVFESLKGREQNGEPVVDALADPHLQHWVHDERLVHVAKTLLKGDNLAYFGDGGYAVIGHGYEAGKDVGGWHRDNTDRSDTNAPDWQGRYSLVRFGFYLQDHKARSGGLIVRRDSHNRILRGWKAHLHDRYLNTGIGDVGVWNMRIQHAGLGRCIRGIPGLALGPYLQKRLPQFLQAPFPKEERTGFWISYGLNDQHLERHCQYLLTRSERKVMWSNSHYSEAILDDCRAAGLQVIDMPSRMRAAIAAGEEVGFLKHHRQLAY